VGLDERTKDSRQERQGPPRAPRKKSNLVFLGALGIPWRSWRKKHFLAHSPHEFTLSSSPPRSPPSKTPRGMDLRRAVDNSFGARRFCSGFFGVSDRVPPVVGRESVRRKWRRLPSTETGPHASKAPCEASNCGYGRDRRPAIRPPETNEPQTLSRQVGLRSPPVVLRVVRGESPPRIRASDPREARAGQ
jgi:hypothetical protein